MCEIVFDYKEQQPTQKSLTKAIGPSAKCLAAVKQYICKQYGETIEEWKFYGKKYGWQLKTLLKKRNLFFVIPYKTCFKIGFVFGDKAVKVIEESDMSDELIEQVLNAKKYMEGRGLSFVVKDKTYLEDIKKLIDIKIEN